jgi:hypothetical protein
MPFVHRPSRAHRQPAALGGRPYSLRRRQTLGPARTDQGQGRDFGSGRWWSAQARSFAFRTSLFPDGQGGHFMMVNKQMQRGAGVGPGMTARFRLEPDTDCAG